MVFGDTTSTTAPGVPVNAAPPVRFIPAGQSMVKIFRAVVSVTVWSSLHEEAQMFVQIIRGKVSDSDASSTCRPPVDEGARADR